MLPLPSIVQSADHAAQVNCGPLSAYQVNRSDPIWTIPGINSRSAYAKTLYNDLQGENSTPPLISTLPDALKRRTSQFWRFKPHFQRSIPAVFVHSRVNRPDRHPVPAPRRSYLELPSLDCLLLNIKTTEQKFSTEHFFTENPFSTENIFISQIVAGGRRGGRAGAGARVEELKSPLKISEK